MYWNSNVLVALSVLASAGAQSLTDVLGQNDQLSTLASILGNLKFASSLQSGTKYTIFAPVNAAFANSSITASATATTMVNGAPLSDVLDYHVIMGSALMASSIKNGSGTINPTLLTAKPYDNLAGGVPQMVNPVLNGTVAHVYGGAKNASTIITKDITFDNGVIHTIDKLLVLPLNATATAKKNSTLSLSGFSGAVGNANITSYVDSTPNLTIFGTMNAGFTKADINPPEVDMARLKDIMTYHILALDQVYYAHDLSLLSNNTNLTTVEGKPLTIHFNGSTSHIQVNNASVKTANVLLTNGVLHIIDQLLNPASEKGFSGGFMPTPNVAGSVVVPTSAFAAVLAVAAFFL